MSTRRQLFPGGYLYGRRRGDGHEKCRELVYPLDDIEGIKRGANGLYESRILKRR